MNFGSQEDIRPRSNSKSGKKHMQIRASSENRNKVNNRAISNQRPRQNKNEPQSLGNTNGKLAQDLKNLNGPNKGHQLGSTVGVGQLNGIGQMYTLFNNQYVEANYYNNHSGNRSSFQGTLKGGLGIMANISNNDEDNFDMTKGDFNFNTGKILNIENVLN